MSKRSEEGTLQQRPHAHFLKIVMHHDMALMVVDNCLGIFEIVGLGNHCSNSWTVKFVKYD